jgi:pimeloyl-ACP methyl ester carboxylesterase
MRNTSFVCFITLLLALVCAPAAANPLDTATPAPAWTKTVGTLAVAKYGSGSPALILVPGLGCGPWSWRDTIASESKAHTVYAVTLAGMDGVPYTSNASLDSADASLMTLISSEKLSRPVLIGHSLGGFLALRFGTEHSDIVSGIVSVDGLPVFPELAEVTREQRKAQADRIGTMIANQTPGEFRAAELRLMRDYVTNQALADSATVLVERSDQAAMAAYTKQLFSADIRPQLSKLTARTMLIAPIPGPPLPSYIPAQLGGMSPDQLRATLMGFYNSLVAGAPALLVVPVDNSRHFVMFDQPAAFAKTLDGFIGSLPPI